MLKEKTQQPMANQDIKSIRGNWIEIESEWAYWIDPRYLSFKRIKKRVPVGSIIVIKSRESLDEERTYVKSTFAIAERTGIARLTKKEVSDILVEQVLAYMQWNEQWPPFTSIKKILNSGDVELRYEPTEYDSFILTITHVMIGDDPNKFLGNLREYDTMQDPPWRVETAKSGRAKCRSCRDVILEGRFRIGEPYFYEGNLSYRWYHPRCVKSRFDVEELEALEGYSKLKAEEKLRLRRLLTS